ncbi:hypothetical protein [Actinopolymorpha rutila]|uniref:Uncharacterized protein n=1 Tax=Actinopolymorpha rutila TaxID=446787 RepID=A0A852ZKY4_9ACTN|nr:hypothetical protein [Actinopolymorpha rutila]NYH92272.1 hypothetical protein [Actinopolymorpha rutila]
MTPDVLVVAAQPEAAFSLTQVRVMAVGSGIALAVAFGTLPLVSPRSRKPLGVAARFTVGLITSVVCGLYVYGRSRRSSDDDATGLQLYIIATMSVVIMRVIFARWFTRVAQAQRSGKQVKPLGAKWTVVVLVMFVTVVASLAATLTWLPRLWA